MHGNARLSPLGRLGMVLRVIEGEPVARVARRCGSVPAVRVQVGAPLPGRRPSRFGRPVVSAALLPHAHQSGGGRTGATSAAGGAGGPVVGVYGGAGADDQPHPPPPQSFASVGMRPADRRTAQNPSRAGRCDMNVAGRGSCYTWTSRNFRPYLPAGNGRYTAAATKPENQALNHWLHYCNNHRPHYSLGGKPPTSRL